MGIRVSQNYGYHFEVPIVRIIVYGGSILGSPYGGKVPSLRLDASRKTGSA